MKAFRFQLGSLFSAASLLSIGLGMATAEETERKGDGLDFIPPTQFQALIDQSPFTRRLNQPGMLILTEVAYVGDQPLATIFDRDSERTMLLSESSSDSGWKLIEVQQPDDLNAAVAIIASETGEIFEAFTAQALLAKEGGEFQLGQQTGVKQLETLEAKKLLPDWVDEVGNPALKGDILRGLIEGGAFDEALFETVDMALTLAEPEARGPALSAVFARLGGGVRGADRSDTEARVDSLPAGRDRDFALNGLAHGLARKDPQSALERARSISSDGFRRAAVQAVSRRIENQSRN